MEKKESYSRKFKNETSDTAGKQNRAGRGLHQYPVKIFCGKRFLYVCSMIICTTTVASAQQTKIEKKKQDSLINSYMKEAAVSNPVLRQAIISTEFIGKGTVTSNLRGKKIAENKMSQIRTTALFNIPVIAWGKNSVSTTLSIGHQHNTMDKPANDPLFDSQNIDFDKGVAGFTASFQRIDSLFNRPVVYVGNITGVSNTADKVQKVSYMAGAIFTLKQKENIRLSVGLLLNIDPSISFPAIPVVNYWHKFSNSYELNVSLPQRLSLEKNLTNKLRASFSTQLGGAVAFFNLSEPGLPRDVNYTTIDLRTGPGIEYRFAKNFVVGVNAGMYTPLSARAFENNESSNDYFFDNKLSAAPYVNVTLSLLPVFKLFK